MSTQGAAEPTPVDKSPALDLSQIFEPIRADLEAVEHEFARHVQSRVELIPEIGKYIQKSGGKRVRPAVLLMAARLSGYTGRQAVLYAAVVEFIHTATLVHDDIIDQSDLRRGRLAVHSRWGNDVTVLLGDTGGFRAAPGSPYAAGPGAFHVALGDIDGDGRQDIAVSSFDGAAVTLLLRR